MSINIDPELIYKKLYLAGSEWSSAHAKACLLEECQKPEFSTLVCEYLEGQLPVSPNGDVAILHGEFANLRFTLAFKTGLTYVFFEAFLLVAIFAPPLWSTSRLVTYFSYKSTVRRYFACPHRSTRGPSTTYSNAPWARDF